MVSFLRKALVGLVVVILGFVFALGLGIVIPRPFAFPDGEASGQVDRSQSRRILILSNPIHTDIALPADPDILKAFDFVSANGLDLDHPGVFWIVFGWGGRSFYVETPTWSDLKPGPVIDALTWDASVMHVRRTGEIPQSLDAVTALDLNQQDFTRLVADIRRSFRSTPGEVPVPIPSAAYDAHDIFFPAVGGFNALVGCNIWTARMLRTAGYRTGVWTPLPATLTWSVILHNRL